MEEELLGTDDELGFEDELLGLLLEETGIELDETTDELEEDLLDELLWQIDGSDAQYASLQVSMGQSGQLLPCGQLNPELALDELLLVLTVELETPQPLTTPKGAGCEAQVELEIQLLPFS